MDKFELKTKEDIEVMRQGGKILAEVKKELFDKIDVGVSAWEIEELADRLISQKGGEASFKKVPDYSWATCINVNAGLVHGIPKKEIIFKKGDLVSVDLGVYFKGFHTDSSFSKGVGVEKDVEVFLKAGEEALKKAITKAVVGGRIYDISSAIETTIKGSGYSPIRALVGHGVGRELHEDPQIPCFTLEKREETMEIKPGMVLAIEVMYALGKPDLVIESDGWTISTRDGKISALFEETVAVTEQGAKVLTTLENK